MQVKQDKKILSIVHVASIRKVYLGLDDGSVLMYDDELPPGLVTQVPACVKVDPLMEYLDSKQTSSCLLAIPRNETLSAKTNNPQQGLPENSQIQAPLLSSQPTTQQSSTTVYELWVGQKNGFVTVLNAETLAVIAYIYNPFDLSRVASYISFLVCNQSYIYQANSEPTGTAGCIDLMGASALDTVSVYGVVYHGQYVTRWNTETRAAVESFNCEKHLEEGEGMLCNIIITISVSLSDFSLLLAHTSNTGTPTNHTQSVTSLLYTTLSFSSMLD